MVEFRRISLESDDYATAVQKKIENFHTTEVLQMRVRTINQIYSVN